MTVERPRAGDDRRRRRRRHRRRRRRRRRGNGASHAATPRRAISRRRRGLPRARARGASSTIFALELRMISRNCELVEEKSLCEDRGNIATVWFEDDEDSTDPMCAARPDHGRVCRSAPVDDRAREVRKFLAHPAAGLASSPSSSSAIAPSMPARRAVRARQTSRRQGPARASSSSSRGRTTADKSRCRCCGRKVVRVERQLASSHRRSSWAAAAALSATRSRRFAVAEEGGAGPSPRRRRCSPIAGRRVPRAPSPPVGEGVARGAAPPNARARRQWRTVPGGEGGWWRRRCRSPCSGATAFLSLAAGDSRRPDMSPSPRRRRRSLARERRRRSPPSRKRSASAAKAR